MRGVAGKQASTTHKDSYMPKKLAASIRNIPFVLTKSQPMGPLSNKALTNYLLSHHMMMTNNNIVRSSLAQRC